MPINEIYQALHTLGLVSSQVEFSRLWLGKSARYYSSLLARQHQPSLGTLGALQHRIRRTLEFTEAGASIPLATLLTRLDAEVARRIVCDPALRRTGPSLRTGRGA